MKTMKTNSPVAATIPCPACEDGTLIPLVQDFETESDGRRITVRDVEMERCDACGETVLTPVGSAHVSRFLAAASDSLSREELLQFLSQYELTHKEASDILGSGEKNFSRWLNGKQRVSMSMSNYIRTLTAVPEAFEALKQRKWSRPAAAQNFPSEQSQPDAEGNPKALSRTCGE